MTLVWQFWTYVSFLNLTSLKYWSIKHYKILMKWLKETDCIVWMPNWCFFLKPNKPLIERQIFGVEWDLGFLKANTNPNSLFGCFGMITLCWNLKQLKWIQALNKHIVILPLKTLHGCSKLVCSGVSLQ